MTRKRQNKVKRIKNAKIIFCEGVTEKNYFEMLKNKYNSKNIKVIDEGGLKAGKLVEKAISYLKKSGNKRKYSDGNVYVCFDRDNLSNEQMKRTISVANENHIKIIYSNPCFEYWLVSHFLKLEAALTASQLFTKLKENLYLEMDYENMKGYDLTEQYENKISFAEKNLNKITTKVINDNIINVAPYTNMHLYIKEIFNVDSL